MFTKDLLNSLKLRSNGAPFRYYIIPHIDCKNQGKGLLDFAIVLGKTAAVAVDHDALDFGSIFHGTISASRFLVCEPILTWALFNTSRNIWFENLPVIFNLPHWNEMEDFDKLSKYVDSDEVY